MTRTERSRGGRGAGRSWVAGRARLAGLVALASLLVAVGSRAASFPAASGRGGAVASAEAAATEAGLEILRAGGNAADAAVATALALAVVHPEAGNLGGGGFAVLRLGGRLESLDFRETAPARARPDMYLDADGRPRPEASQVGPLAAGVPGSPAGLWELHRRHGALPWAQVVEPARRLAADGFRVSARLHRALAEKTELLARFPETARVWLPGGAPPPAGSRMRLPELAATLAAYAERGPEALTTGPLAAAVERASAAHGGILETADLAAYRPVWRQPVRFAAFGWSFASIDLPSSGGIAVGQALLQLEALGWPAWPRGGADRAHLLAETLRRVFADRFLLGDPASTAATAEQLLAADWLARRRADLDPNRATPSSAVVSGTGPGAASPVAAAAGAAGPTDTTHLAVVDAAGNLVALTTTLNGSFGCGLLVPETGYLLNNQMDDFTTAPGRPNLYGLIQGEANAVAPGRRMLSSMSPTIAWRDDEAVALGGRGGSRIPTSVLQVLLNLLVDGDPLQAALDRPRLHHQWLPDQISSEPDALAPETRSALEARGHRVTLADPDLSKVHAVRLLPGGRLEAAADPRGPGVAGAVDPDG